MSGVIRLTQPILVKEELAYRHDEKAQYLAEFVGTFFLVFTVGCNVHTGSIGAAVSIGAVLMVMVYALGPVSGAHLNPAVTLAVGLSGRNMMSLEKMFCYMLAQITGGIVGAVHYWLVFNDGFVLQPISGYTARTAAWAEILYTMALCYVVLNVATTSHPTQGNVKSPNFANNFYGLAIGLTVTSAAIAMGPVSGCSLNPAVSIGAMFAAKLAHGIFTMSMAALYILGPLFGACLGALFFFFVQGGLTGQFEYEMMGSRPSTPIVSRPASPPISPAPLYVEPPAIRHRCEMLGKGEVCMLTAEEMRHNLFCGVSWKVDSAAMGNDIDFSAVKFDSYGRFIESIYFQNAVSTERRGSPYSHIVHEKDDRSKGIGFGFVEDPTRHHRHGQPPVTFDNERICLKPLNSLRKEQPRCTYIFFVLNVFSAAHRFAAMQELTVRIVDQDNQGNEICRWSKNQMDQHSMTRNGFILMVLHWLKEEAKWVFEVVDQSFDIEAHGTYRAFEPTLREYVLKMEGRFNK